MTSLDDEKTMRLWLRRSLMGALWLTTNTLCIITRSSLGPLIVLSTRKIGMDTSARHRKSVEGRARFSGG